jgi:hypothetical protein
MLAGPHFAGYAKPVVSLGMLVFIIIVALLEYNAIKGKLGPMATVSGVIVSSLILTAVLVASLEML